MIFIQELYSGGNDWQIILWTPLFDEYDEKQQHVCVSLFLCFSSLSVSFFEEL
jgi:hypothetical protein